MRKWKIRVKCHCSPHWGFQFKTELVLYHDYQWKVYIIFRYFTCVDYSWEGFQTFRSSFRIIIKSLAHGKSVVWKSWWNSHKLSIFIPSILLSFACFSSILHNKQPSDLKVYICYQTWPQGAIKQIPVPASCSTAGLHLLCTCFVCMIQKECRSFNQMTSLVAWTYGGKESTMSSLPDCHLHMLLGFMHI